MFLHINVQLFQHLLLKRLSPLYCFCSSVKGWLTLFFLNFIYLFLERRERREKEREKNINVWLPLACPLLGTWPTIQTCALTGNGTSNPLVHRPELSPLSHTSQGTLYTNLIKAVFFSLTKKNHLEVRKFRYDFLTLDAVHYAAFPRDVLFFC